MSQFADVLRSLGSGQTYDDLGTKLTEIVQAVMESHKSGELVLKLKIKANGEQSVIITDEIKQRIPEKARGETLFFTTAAGTLMRDDPRQSKLPLRAVEAAIPGKGA